MMIMIGHALQGNLGSMGGAVGGGGGGAVGGKPGQFGALLNNLYKCMLLYRAVAGIVVTN